MMASNHGRGIGKWEPPSELRERFVQDIHLSIKYLLRICVSSSGDTEMSKTDTWTCLLRAYHLVRETKKWGKCSWTDSCRILEGLWYQPGESQSPLISAEWTWYSRVRIMSCSCESCFATNPLCVHQLLTILIHIEIRSMLATSQHLQDDDSRKEKCVEMQNKLCKCMLVLLFLWSPGIML